MKILICAIVLLAACHPTQPADSTVTPMPNGLIIRVDDKISLVIDQERPKWNIVRGQDSTIILTEHDVIIIKHAVDPVFK